MSTNKISKIRVKGIDYEVKDKKQSGVNTITSLTSIPNTKEQVIANLAGPTEFSLSAMEPGDSIEVTCIPSKDFKQSVTGDNIKTTFDGKIYAKQNSPFKIYVDCYENSNIFVDVDNKGKLAYFILVSTSDMIGTLLKYTNPNGSSTETITIPANSTDYKVDGLIYGFKLDDGQEFTSLDVSSFDTSKVTNMDSMFSGCSSLRSLDVSSFDTSNVTSMRNMFYNCNWFSSLDLSNFDTSKVTDMSYMFGDCSDLTTLDLSNFDTSKATDTGYMFGGCNSLTRIKCKQAFKDWCWTNQDNIGLPSAMRSGGSGQWEIVS